MRAGCRRRERGDHPPKGNPNLVIREAISLSRIVISYPARFTLLGWTPVEHRARWARMGIAEIVNIFQVLGETLQGILRQGQVRNELERIAVSRLLEAVIKTQAYLHDIQGGGDEDRDEERKLARMWGDAASAFHGVDDAFATRLLFKAESWASPSSWPDEKVTRMRITIEEISNEASKFLSGAER